MSKRLRVLVLLILQLCVFSSFTLQVHAETEEDLLNIYGKSSNAPIKADLEKRIQNIYESIDAINALNTKHEEYNNIIDIFNNNQSDIYLMAETTVNDYGTRNREIVEDIESNVLYGDINVMLDLDKAYKNNSMKIDDIIDSLNNIYICDGYKRTDYNIEGLYANVESLNEQYKEAIDAVEIGDVSNIDWLMNNDYYITSRFGYRLDPISKTQIKFHSGTDYRCSIGTEVGALFDGVVLDTGCTTTSGNYVSVQSGERIKYYYCHLDKVLVEPGDIVNQYDVIALTGSTGTRCTGPHLHLALYIDGVACDVSKIFEQ